MQEKCISARPSRSCARTAAARPTAWWARTRLTRPKEHFPMCRRSLRRSWGSRLATSWKPAQRKPRSSRFPRDSAGCVGCLARFLEHELTLLLHDRLGLVGEQGQHPGKLDLQPHAMIAHIDRSCGGLAEQAGAEI